MNGVIEPPKDPVEPTQSNLDTIASTHDERESEPSRKQFISQNSRSRTNFEKVESRPFSHAQLIKRPRALHFHSIGDEEEKTPASHVTSNTTSNDAEEPEQENSEDIPRLLARIDLFVDLIWVGIIANLSETFAQQAFTENGVSTSTAVGEFVLLFLPIWRIWDALRSYTSNYYVNDLFQRLFIVWIIVLAVVYGINAPYAYNPDNGPNSLKLLITVYLIAKASFLASGCLHALLIPFLRRQFLFEFCTTIGISALWIAAIWVPYPGKLGLLILGNIEQPVALWSASPLGEKLLIPKGFKRKPDVERHIARYEGFFVVILGAGESFQNNLIEILLLAKKKKEKRWVPLINNILMSIIFRCLRPN